MSTDPTRPTRAEIAEQVRVVRAAQDDVDALLVAAPSAPADQNLRDRIAAAIWERQNPGRRWADCEYRWRADAEDDADAVLAVLSTPADRAAVLREAADEVDAETQRLQDHGVLEPDKFRPCRDATADLRRMADEAQQAGEQLAYPPVLRWRIELYDPLAEEWNPGSSLGKREDIVDRFEAITSRSPKWKDGTPVQRRIVREATTYTIEEPDRG